MPRLIIATATDDLQCVGCGKDLKQARMFKDGVRCEHCEICEACGTAKDLGTLADGTILCQPCASTT